MSGIGANKFDMCTSYNNNRKLTYGFLIYHEQCRSLCFGWIYFELERNKNRIDPLTEPLSFLINGTFILGIFMFLLKMRMWMWMRWPIITIIPQILHKTTRAPHLSNPSFKHLIAFGSICMRINNNKKKKWQYSHNNNGMQKSSFTQLILHIKRKTVRKKTEINGHIENVGLIMDRLLSGSISGHRILG